jgi:hypothetical protein
MRKSQNEESQYEKGSHHLRFVLPAVGGDKKNFNPGSLEMHMHGPG